MIVPRILIFAILLVAGGTVGHSQVVVSRPGEVASLNQSVFGLGLSGGPASGIGLSFRHHLPAPVSYQITGGIIKIDETLSYSIGGEVQYDLVAADAFRFFAAAGVGYYYSGENRNEMEAPARGGVGIGGEVEAYSGIHFLGEALFTFFSDGTILPLPQVGFYYYFY